MIYVIASETLKKQMKGFVKQKGGAKKTATLIGSKDRNIHRYLRGARAVPIGFIEFMANKLSTNIWKILDGEKLKSKNRYFRISETISIEECNFLGWLLTDGHIPKNGFRVTIDQQNIEYLKRMKKNLEKCFDIRSGITISPDKNNWKLRIAISGFREYFNLRYGIPMGKKSGIIRVPKDINNISPEKQFAFIAACIDGDGSFSYYWRKNTRGKYRVPRITINSNSIDFLKDIQRLLGKQNITSKINLDKETRKLNILKAEDCVKLFYNIYPYLIHEEKKKHFIKILSDYQLLNTLRIKMAGKIITKWKKKLGLDWISIAKLIENNCQYRISPFAVKNWSYNWFSVPVSVIIKACDDLNEEYLNWMPNEYLFLLSIRK